MCHCSPHAFSKCLPSVCHTQGRRGYKDGCFCTAFLVGIRKNVKNDGILGLCSLNDALSFLRRKAMVLRRSQRCYVVLLVYFPIPPFLPLWSLPPLFGPHCFHYSHWPLLFPSCSSLYIYTGLQTSSLIHFKTFPMLTHSSLPYFSNSAHITSSQGLSTQQPDLKAQSTYLQNVLPCHPL